MNTIINLAVKWSGLGKVWQFFDGKKAYAAGLGLVLLGASKLLVAIAALHSPAEALALIKSLSADSEAIKIILEGLGILGVRHSVAKAAPAEK